MYFSEVVPQACLPTILMSVFEQPGVTQNSYSPLFLYANNYSHIECVVQQLFNSIGGGKGEQQCRPVGTELLNQAVLSQYGCEQQLTLVLALDKVCSPSLDPPDPFHEPALYVISHNNTLSCFLSSDV